MKKKQIIIILGVLFTIGAVLCLIYLPSALPKIERSGIYTSIIAIYLLLILTLALLFLAIKRPLPKEDGENAVEEGEPEKGQSKGRGIYNSFKNLYSTKNITRTAIFSALSIVMYYYVKFPVPAVFPSFLDFQFSDLPAILAGFMINPVAGVFVIIIKTLVKLPASSTYCVGELVDLCLGISYVLTASIIYRYKRTLKGAIIGLVAGSLVCTLLAAILNRFVAVPLYMQLMFDGNWTFLINAMNKIFGGKVTKDNFFTYYIFLSVIPFNLLRCLITSVLTFLTYKHLKKALNHLW